MKKFFSMTLACALIPAVAQARDTTHYLPVQAVVQEALNAGRLDGTVKFYFATQPKGARIVQSGAATNKKTNAFGKSDEKACSWALQSALIQMQNAAKAAGANAVVNLTSNYRQKPYKSTDKYECHAGAVIAGVALKGDLAKVR